MFFKEHEKLVYRPPFIDDGHLGYDPLAVDRALTIYTKGEFASLVETWKGPEPDTGDVSKEGLAGARVNSACAEAALSRAARHAFGLPPFPDATDAVALEYLCHYLEYMEGKGSRPYPGSCSVGPAPDSHCQLRADTTITSGSISASNGTGPSGQQPRLTVLPSEPGGH